MLIRQLLTTKKLLKLCNENNMPAVAITDTSNMFGALEISELLSKDGIQPVIGCQLDFLYDPQNLYDPLNKKLVPRPIVLLAKNKAGYQNLMKLSSIGYLEYDHSDPYIKFGDLEVYGDGLICLSGGTVGPLGHELLYSNSKSVELLTDRFLKIFGDRFYLELSRHPSQGSQKEKNIAISIF